MEGNPPALQLVADTSSQAGQAGEQALRAALLRLNISAVISRSAVQAAKSQKPYTDGGQKNSAIRSAALLSMEGWSKPAFTIQTQSGAKPTTG